MLDPSVVDRYLTEDNLVFIENEFLRLGANLSLGGALTYLAEKGRKNLINSWDWGRQVQMSCYSGPAPFQPEGTEMAECWKFIGWNPIQSGDHYGNRSKILEYRAEDTELYVKCIPMHWPLDNYPGECTYEVWYRLNGRSVDVTAKINNARPDQTLYPARNQELPAVYTNGEWYKAVSYVGKEPFTGGALTELVAKDDGLGWPWIYFCPTENWSALVDDENYGLGVYNGIVNRAAIGFAGVENKGWGGPKDGQTGYIAPISTEILDHNIEFSYDYSLIVGSVDVIRQIVYEKDKTADRRHYDFSKGRDHFYYKDTTDQGYPTGGCLAFDFSAGAEWKSPAVFIGKGEDRALELDLAFDGEITGEVVCQLYEGIDEKHWHKLRPFAVPFALSASGERATHRIDLSAVPDAMVGFSIRFGCEGHLKVYSLTIV